MATATGPGVHRVHLFEPQRQVNYALVRLDPARLERQRFEPRANRRFWWAGGWLARLWGYRREQRYGGTP